MPENLLGSKGARMTANGGIKEPPGFKTGEGAFWGKPCGGVKKRKKKGELPSRERCFVLGLIRGKIIEGTRKNLKVERAMKYLFEKKRGSHSLLVQESLFEMESQAGRKKNHTARAPKKRTSEEVTY